MPTLRLFANLREIAGVSRLDIEAGTVAEVLAKAKARFGAVFSEGALHAQVWRNGEPAQPNDPVSGDDEVALIPPVSGGASSFPPPTGATEVQADLQSIVLVLVAGVLVVANLAPGAAWWGAAVVGALAWWVVDIVGSSERGLPEPPLLASALVGVLAAHRLGSAGLGLAVALAVVISLSWGVGLSRYRGLKVVGPTVLLSVVVVTAAGSFFLARNGLDLGSKAVSIFLAMVVGATLLGLVLQRLGSVRFLDPVSGSALLAVVVAIVGAEAWDFDVVGFLLIGVGTALALIAGRGLGAMVRTGRVSLVVAPPGLLATLDGPVLAATLFFPLLRLLL